MPAWLIVISYLSIALGIVTAAIITIDVIAHPQPMRIMNVVWPVTGLYFPVIGWWFYRSLGRPMHMDMPQGTHAGMQHMDMHVGAGQMHMEKQPFWKSIFTSSTHCGAGCVLGDIIGAPIVFAAGWTLFGMRLFADYVVEFVLAYCFGIAFQYLAIKSMRQVSRHQALIGAVKADTLSLIAYEVGMFGWMAVVVFLLLPGRPLDPTMAVFWFMMQIGMVLGFVTTYPANWLLVRSGVKSAM
jgi:Domain of unknown function (DUF4396)